MKRMTQRYKDKIFVDTPETAISHLAAIEDILGEEYDLEQLRKLWFADQKGHCVVFDEHYPVVSEYYRDEEWRYIRESSGVISEAEYKKAMGDG